MQLRNSLKVLQRQGVTTLALVSISLVFGISSITFGLKNQVSIPEPKVVPTSASNIISESPDVNVRPSEPLSIAIPKISLAADEIISLGKNSDNSVEIPQGPNYDKPGWYKHSVTPGENGSSVILGHVDSYKSGPSVFFYLGELQPNDEVTITREDSSKAVFRITEIRSVNKGNFPTNEVYGTSSTPTLKLVSCGGRFDKATGEYENNIIVFASLVDFSV